MGADSHHRARGKVWGVAAKQHGVITRRQLIDLGFSSKAIRHRLARGRLHRVHAGVYAVGRADLTRYGTCMAAVLRCGPGAAVSHEDAGALWGIRPAAPGATHVSVPAHVSVRHAPGIVVHRRQLAVGDVTERYGIPVTTPVCTLVDLAARGDGDETEAAVSEADKLGLITTHKLRAALDALPRRPGRAPLRRLP